MGRFCGSAVLWLYEPQNRRTVHTLMSEQAQLLPFIAWRQRMKAMRGRPLGTRPGPVEARHDHLAARVELDPFGFEQLALLEAARADAALLRDDPLPRHRASVLRRHVAQRIADGACVAAPADDRRDIAISRDHAVWHLRGGLIDSLVERVVGRGAHRIHSIATFAISRWGYIIAPHRALVQNQLNAGIIKAA